MTSGPSPRGGPYLFLAVCIAVAAGCGDDLDAPAADAAVMPSALRVTGVAEGNSGDDRVQCIFTLDLVDIVADQAGGMSGLALGEVFRRTFDGDAPRFEFQALVGGPGTLAPGDGVAVEARLVGDQPTDAAPFWLAMEVLAGSEIGPFQYAGRWVCAELLVGDPMDSPIEADGTWSAVPLVADG